MLSDEYKALLTEMHAVDKKWGDGAFGFAQRIHTFAHVTKSKTVLDYGCGKRTLEHGLRHINSHLRVVPYDPGIPEIADNRKPCDMVVSLDVIEHIEPDYLDLVMQDIKNLAGRAVYLHIATTPARQILPDGRNAHLIVWEYPRWRKYLRDWWGDEIEVINYKGVLAKGIKV